MSRVLMSSLLLLASASACSPKEAAAPADAGVVTQPVIDAGITQVKPFDPAGGMHLDDDGDAPPTVIGAGPATKGKRGSRPIDVMLRSTPPGARAAVDGVFVGTTPTYWAGDADGREHEFTFVLGKHESRRYRFVPVTSGVVHAKLDPISDDVPAPNLEPVLAPPSTLPPVTVPMAPPPDAAPRITPPVAPPPTVLTPDAPPPPVTIDAAAAPATPTPAPVVTQPPAVGSSVPF